MSSGKSDKPSRTVQFDTGLAMTLSCGPMREGDAAPGKPSPAATEAQQRGTAK